MASFGSITADLCEIRVVHFAVSALWLAALFYLLSIARFTPFKGVGTKVREFS